MQLLLIGIHTTHPAYTMIFPVQNTFPPPILLKKRQKQAQQN